MQATLVPREETLPMIRFRDVVLGYSRKIVITGLNLDVPDGLTFGLMGLNGAGKTTLIKALLGLRELRGGAISIAGDDASKPGAHRNLAYLPERFDPPWFLKGDEFIKFSVELYKAPFDRAEMETLAARLKLDPKVLRNRMQTYSKGMRQKVGLMATILTGCPLLVLDEPMSGLDPAARAAVKDVLRDVRAAGRTVFFSSHILADIDEICDTVAVLHRGEIMFTGQPSALKQRGGSENLERSFLSVIGDTSFQSD